MKISRTIFAYFCIGIYTALGGDGNQAVIKTGRAIRQLPLDERSVYNITIATNVPTTINLPYPIDQIDAAELTVDPDDYRSPVLISHTPGTSFFTIKAQHAGEGAANVIVRGKTYAFTFRAGPNPVRSVSLIETHARNGSTRVSPPVLLAILDRCKTWDAVTYHYPELASQIEHSSHQERFDYKDFAVYIEQIWRFDAEDTLVFQIILHNTSQNTIYYDPQALAVRSGNEVYYQSIADASGVMKPDSLSLLYFAITGTADGGRNNLSAESPFIPIITRIDGPTSIHPNTTYDWIEQEEQAVIEESSRGLSK